ncbi:MAG: C-GCAxxG-C-C family protein [Candidatus Thorarchaeota archaeon]
MSRVEQALSSFNEDFNCAQSVLSTFSSQYGLERDTALKLATGFGGGVARLGHICGAVSGATMVIGLKYGMGINKNIEAKENTYKVIRDFTNKFQKLHGSILCRELLECDINTIEGKNIYAQNEYFEKKCTQYVKTAVEILEQLL